MFGTAKLVMVGLMITSLAGGVAYVYKLKADNAILKENAIKLEEASRRGRFITTSGDTTADRRL